MCDARSDAEEMLPLLSDVVNCKKAAIVTVFFTYLMYIGVTGLIYILEWKQKEDLVRKLRNFKADIEQKQLFILALSLLIQIQTPTAFPVVMLYLYLCTYPVLFVGHLKEEKWIIKLIAFATQYLFVFILLMFVLINPWCRYYYYRYIVASPPDSYYTSITSNSTNTTSQLMPAPSQIFNNTQVDNTTNTDIGNNDTLQNDTVVDGFN